MNLVQKSAGDSLEAEMRNLGAAAKAAAIKLGLADRAAKDKALAAMAAEIRRSKEKILAANREDVAEAKANGLSGALVDRLMLDDKRIEAMAAGLEDIAALPDPVGRTLAEWQRPNGLKISRIS